MNPMTNVKNIKKLCEEDLSGGNKTSWHEQYRNSAWIFVGGVHYDLTEGDIICVFSQFGEPINIHLVRDKDTGKSKGFCFICYEDQRSTDLAVDNLNGAKLLGRTLRVDHVESYKPPKNVEGGETSEEKKSEIKKKKKKKKKTKQNKDLSPIFEKPNKMNQVSKYQNKKTEKYNHRKYFDSHNSDIHCRKKKEVRIKKNRKRQDSDDEFELRYKSEAEMKKKSKRKLDSSGSLLSSSPFSLSSLSSFATFLSLPAPNSESKKYKKLKTEGHDFHKKNKTVKDLLGQTELIQAELKRRQQTDELVKKSHRDLKEKQESKKESKKKESKSGSSKQQLEDDITRQREI